MKNLDFLNEYRISHPTCGEMGDSYNGVFEIKIRGEKYGIIASNGGGWDHVSVSHKHKIPSWRVMNAVKEMFFNDDEVVIQIHPAEHDYINICPTCLHLWRNQNRNIELPPLNFV